MNEGKVTVTLRERKIKGGRLSLYLDIYRGGKRTYEPLHIYLEPNQAKSNKEKKMYAQSIAAKRLDEIKSGEFDARIRKKNIFFVDYYNKISTRRNLSAGAKDQYRAALRHMREYDPNIDKKTFADITTDWVTGFRDYLETATGFARNRHTNKPIKPGSKALYFEKLCTTLGYASKEDLASHLLTLDIEPPQREETEREFLTFDEIKKLAATPCSYDILRRTFLFSCLTGIRKSDLKALKWGQVTQNGDFTRITFSQKKTKGVVYLDIPPQAVEYMGTPGSADELVFPNMISESVLGVHLRTWVNKAGIQKYITFHCARHTFATLLLELGTDLYTVSKLLGHKKITTTQIYAKIVDKSRQEAVLTIPLIEGIKSGSK